MAKYLVCRLEGIRPEGNLKHSHFWPMIVECHHQDVESILKIAFDSINRGYIGLYEYIVVPLTDAKIVSYKPRQNYDVSVRAYD